MLDLGIDTAHFAQVVLLPGKAFAVADLGIDLHQLEAQVGTLRFVVDRSLQ
ncbi:hypothetical protein D9M73_161970 [compost metagenome]